MAVQVDLSQESSIPRMVEEVSNRLGPVNILSNDAAFNKPITFNYIEKVTHDDWRKILSVNLDGPFLCCRTIAPTMKKNGSGRFLPS